MRKLALSDEILLSVQQPARYIGGEVNMVVKNPSHVDIRFCMCFPDVSGGWVLIHLMRYILWWCVRVKWIYCMFWNGTDKDDGIILEFKVYDPDDEESLEDTVKAALKQEKFIPIVKEYDEEGNPYLPNYLASRMYLDLVDFDKGYKELLENIMEDSF